MVIARPKPGTGSQAIVSAVEIVPDVLLTDYVLPDVDGLTIARRLKADGRTAAVRIVMVTGYANADLEREAVAIGVDRVLLKPCLPQAVMREVSRTLARPTSPRCETVRRVSREVTTRVRDEIRRAAGSCAHRGAGAHRVRTRLGTGAIAS